MEQISKKPRFYFILLGLVCALSALLPWNQSVFSSHFFRQAQTAQTIDIFLREGLNLFYPKVYFFGSPGFNVLEFPLYQSLVWLLVKLTPLAIENASRLLNCLLALSTAFFVSTLANQLKKPASEKKPGLVLPALLFSSSPLVWGVSQWVSIELLNILLSSASLFVFIKYLDSSKNKPHLLALLFGLLALSLTTKANVILGLSFFFAFVAFSKIKIERLACSTIAAVAALFLAVIWIKHGDRANTLAHNPFAVKLGSSRYILSGENLDLAHTLKILGRFLLYVIGPGTALLLSGVFFSKRRSVRSKLKDNSRLLFAGFFSVIFYVALFFDLNSIHNYYQLACVPPLFILIGAVFTEALESTSPLFLIGAISLNLLTSLLTLNRHEADWDKVSWAVRHELSQLKLKTNEKVFAMTNLDPGQAVLGYSAQTYLDFIPLNEPLAKNGPFIALCESGTNHCKESAEKNAPVCEAAGKTVGKLWYCVARISSKER